MWWVVASTLNALISCSIMTCLTTVTSIYTGLAEQVVSAQKASQFHSSQQKKTKKSSKTHKSDLKWKWRIYQRRLKAVLTWITEPWLINYITTLLIINYNLLMEAVIYWIAVALACCLVQKLLDWIKHSVQLQSEIKFIQEKVPFEHRARFDHFF